MSLSGYVQAVFQADFLQVMALTGGVFLLPLRRRPHGLRRYGLFAAACFALGGLMGVVYRLMEQGAAVVLVPGTPEGVAFQVAYFTLPLAAVYGALRLCTTIPPADAAYGTACVYAVQHTEFCLSEMVGILGPFSDLYWSLLKWALTALVLAAAWLGLVPSLQQDGVYGVTWRRAALALGIMVMIGLVLNYPLRLVAWLRTSLAYPICLGYDIFSCQLFLWLQREQRREVQLAASAAAERRLRVQTQEQYALSRENIDIINRKCHDLKHQVAALRLVTSPGEREQSLREIEQSVMIYDAAVQTGNKVLDTVLTEKSLLCERRQICWTCMADGALLDFLHPVDLYTLFGNALDNAIEASARVAEPAMRNVSVTVQRRLGAAFIQVENYYTGPLDRQGDRLRSTKADAADHGFGLPSIRQIAGRYGGTVDIEAKDHIFTLSILIPLPAA